MPFSVLAETRVSTETSFAPGRGVVIHVTGVVVGVGLAVTAGALAPDDACGPAALGGASDEHALTVSRPTTASTAMIAARTERMVAFTRIFPSDLSPPRPPVAGWQAS
ncbi:hypothetical protein IDVR_04690 [Intrasporangium sp. DVR]